MDVHVEFATDEKLEIEGRWVPFDDKTSFLIARESNPQFLKLFNQLQKRNAMALKAKGPASEELSKNLMVEILAKTILLGWKGPVFYKGEDLSVYSVENAKKVLQPKGFRAWVAEQSADAEAYKLAAEEEAAKN